MLVLSYFLKCIILSLTSSTKFFPHFHQIHQIHDWIRTHDACCYSVLGLDPKSFRFRYDSFTFWFYNFENIDVPATCIYYWFIICVFIYWLAD